MKECPWWGWSFIIKATQSWNLTSTYSELLAKIHNTYTTTYNFNWPVPRTHTYTCTYCFTLRIQVRIASTGLCHVLKTRMYTSTGPYHTYKYVRSTKFFLVECVERMCSRTYSLLDLKIRADVCTCHLPTIQSIPGID